MLEKIATAIGGLLLVALLIFSIAVLSGTVLWVIYPHIHSIFPSAATKGIIATDLGWWDSVCVTWIFAILLKSSSSTTTNNNKK